MNQEYYSKQNKMVSYKLIYFNGRGLAEVARLIFAVAGEKYEDFRFERADWPNHKQNMPFLKAPVLEITDGDKVTHIAQSGMRKYIEFIRLFT